MVPCTVRKQSRGRGVMTMKSLILDISSFESVQRRVVLSHFSGVARMMSALEVWNGQSPRVMPGLRERMETG